MGKIVHEESPKHIISARDINTGEIRVFVFSGELFGGSLMVEEKKAID